MKVACLCSRSVMLCAAFGPDSALRSSFDFIYLKFCIFYVFDAKQHLSKAGGGEFSFNKLVNISHACHNIRLGIGNGQVGDYNLH